MFETRASKSGREFWSVQHDSWERASDGAAQYGGNQIAYSDTSAAELAGLWASRGFIVQIIHHTV